MNQNQAQQARTWMAIVILTGNIPLLPNATPNCPFQKQLPANPNSLVDWFTPQQASSNKPSDTTTPKYIPPHIAQTATILTKTAQTTTSVALDRQPQPCLEGTKLQPHQIWTCFQTMTTSPPVASSTALTQSFPHNQVHLTRKKTHTRRHCCMIHPLNQLTLYDTMMSPTDTSILHLDQWGHHPTAINKGTTFWVILQNPQGLKIAYDQMESQYSMSLAQHLGAGAICLLRQNNPLLPRAATMVPSHTHADLWPMQFKCIAPPT
jgi:hypothetical protein